MCILGKIVKSNSHTDYVCQVVGKGEAEYIPHNTDYALGTFVKIELDEQDDRCLVGLIYDTVLLNPDFGRLGPRLSTESDLQIFSPDYLNERAILIGILVIGQIVEGVVQQGVPFLAATNEARVSQMDSETIRHFHTNEKMFLLTYLPNLIAQTGLLARNLAIAVLQQLIKLMPDNQPILQALADDLKWQLHINSMRG